MRFSGWLGSVRTLFENRLADFVVVDFVIEGELSHA